MRVEKYDKEKVEKELKDYFDNVLYKGEHTTEKFIELLDSKPEIFGPNPRWVQTTSRSYYNDGQGNVIQLD